jgi:hypothetical protein
MKKILVGFFLFILIKNTIVFGQVYDGSIIIESVTLISETQINDENRKSNMFLAYGLYYSGKFNLDANYQIELRPGFTGGQEFYSNLQLGFIIRRKLGSGFFGSLDVFGVLQTGDNSKYASHTIYTGATIGKYFLEEVALLLSVYKPIDTYFGKYWKEEKNLRTYYNVYCDWLVKLGLEINF